MVSVIEHRISRASSAPHRTSTPDHAASIARVILLRKFGLGGGRGRAQDGTQYHARLVPLLASFQHHSGSGRVP